MRKFFRASSILIPIFLSAVIFSRDVKGNLYAQDNSPVAGTVKSDPTGVEMVYVPSGAFQMGVEREVLEALCSDIEISANDCDYYGSQNGILDTYDVVMLGFWIDRYEITIKQFEPYIPLCTDQNICSLDYLDGYTKTWPDLFDDPNKPQVGIDWYIALRFCNSRGARLPTEEEWEYAAGGPENLNFPWGDSFASEDPSSYISIPNTHSVGSKPSNVSWIGAYDMAGNVAEWVEDRLTPYSSSIKTWTQDSQLEVARVYRGGSWGNGILGVATFIRYYTNPLERSQTIGFRCARSSDPNSEQ